MSETKDTAKSISKKIGESTDKVLGFLDPLTKKVRDFVLKFGEIIVTVTVVVGIISAIIDGLSTMANAGFFTGLSSMFSNIVSVIMGALVIFLLFAINNNTKK